MQIGAWGGGGGDTKRQTVLHELQLQKNLC